MPVGQMESFLQLVCGPKDIFWHSLTTNVIKAMKRGYEVSIGGSGGRAQMGQQDGTGNQHDDPETDNYKGGPQPERDQDAQPQQRKQPRMLTNLARYNAPRIKHNENVTGKRN
jgi:hypothetical protein